MSDEETARRIAERGRDALLSRLRPAFAEAASAHADVLTLSEDQLEEMVQRAADRADGLQWRRALASVAIEELGIDLADALAHPAVARAQAIIGAPSYEETLAQTLVVAAGEPEPEPAPAPRASRIAPPRAAPAPATPPPAAAGRPVTPTPGAGRPAPAPPARAPAPRARPAPAPPARARAAPTATPAGTLRMTAIHLDGIASLEPDESGLELRLSDAGLDISRAGAEILGRITWEDMRTLEVAGPRGVRRWRRRRDAALIVRTRQGEATFQIPALSPEELSQHLDPVVKRHLRPRHGLAHDARVPE